MTIPEILAIHPAPWGHRTQGSLIVVTDANNQQVELFTMLDYVVQSTVEISKRETAPL